MQEQGTPSVTTEDEARERLVEWQQEQGGVPTIPAHEDTIEKGGLGVLQRQRLPRDRDPGRRSDRGAGDG